MVEKDRPGKVFVGGLAIDVDEKVLDVAFSKYGRMTEILVIRNKGSGQSKGYGFITFENPLDADDAVKGMDGKDINGQAIHVGQAVKPRGPDDYFDRSRGGRSGPPPRRGGRGAPRGRGSGGMTRERSPRGGPPRRDSFQHRSDFSPPRSGLSRRGGPGGYGRGHRGPPSPRDAPPPRRSSYLDREDRYDSFTDRLPQSREREDRYGALDRAPPTARGRDMYGQSPPREYPPRNSYQDSRMSAPGRRDQRDYISPQREFSNSRSREYDRGLPPQRAPMRDRDYGAPSPQQSRNSYRDEYQDSSRDYGAVQNNRSYGAPAGREYPQRDSRMSSRNEYDTRGGPDREYGLSRDTGRNAPYSPPRSRGTGSRDQPPSRNAYPPPSSRSSFPQSSSYPSRGRPDRSPVPRSGGDRYSDREPYGLGSRRPASPDGRGPPIKRMRSDLPHRDSADGPRRGPPDMMRRGPPNMSRRGKSDGPHRGGGPPSSFRR